MTMPLGAKVPGHRSPWLWKSSRIYFSNSDQTWTCEPVRDHFRWGVPSGCGLGRPFRAPLGHRSRRRQLHLVRRQGRKVRSVIQTPHGGRQIRQIQVLNTPALRNPNQIQTLHILQMAQVTSKKVVHKKRHHFLATFSIPFHMVWSVLLRVVAHKTTFWLVEILWQPIRSFYSMVFEATTRNKMKHIMWKGMENCARKWCLFLCTILFEVTWAFGKMCLENLQIRHKIKV